MNLISNNLSQEEEALRLAYTDLIAFGKLFLPGDFKRSKTPFFHYEIGDAYLDDSIWNLAAIIARSHAKTTLTKALILHDFLFNDFVWENGGLVKKKQRPLFYGWVADRHKKSVQNVDYVKMNIEGNPKIIRYFGNQKGRKWTEEDIILKNDCTLLSRSNASSLRGETKGGVHGTERYHRIILDDIENEDNTISDTSRDKIKRTVQNAVYPSLDPDKGRLIFNGTPVHHDSLCQNILDGYRKAVEENREEQYSWYVITYGATQPEMPGGVLWQDYWPREKLDRKKQFYEDNDNVAGYYQEFELQVQSDEDRLWTEQHLQYHRGYYQWDEDEEQGFLVIGGQRYPVNTFIGCDPATDIDTKTSDYSVVLVIAVDNANNVYVLDYIRERAIPSKGLRDNEGEIIGKKGVVDYLLEMYDTYHCANATVENVAMTRSIWQDMQAEFRRQNRWDYAMVSEEPGGREKRNKIYSGLNNRFAGRTIHIKEGMGDLKHEIINFGEKLGKDDLIESLYFACKNAYPSDREKQKFGGYKPKFQPTAKPWVTA